MSLPAPLFYPAIMHCASVFVFFFYKNLNFFQRSSGQSHDSRPFSYSDPRQNTKWKIVCICVSDHCILFYHPLVICKLNTCRYYMCVHGCSVLTFMAIFKQILESTALVISDRCVYPTYVANFCPIHALMCLRYDHIFHFYLLDIQVDTCP